MALTSKGLPILYVDSSELIAGSSKKIFLSLKKSDKIVVKRENLGDAIDFLIKTKKQMYGIQRKKPTEMAGKGALRDIAEMLLIDNMKPYLLLEGSWKSLEHTKYAKNVIVKRLYEIAEDYGVTILPSGSRKYTVKWLIYLTIHFGIDREIDLTKIRSGIPGNSVLKKLRKKLKKEEISEEDYIKLSTPILQNGAVYFLTGIEGVSKVLARRLLKEYDTVEYVIEGKDEWRDHVRGFGRSIHRNSSEMMTVSCKNAEW